MSAKSKVQTATSEPAVTPPTGPMPPGGPIEIVFSFDTTPSMSGVLGEVRKKVQEVINRLLTDIPALKISVFAHGDYDTSHNYVTKYVDFTNDPKKLCHFVQTAKSTPGGFDWEECYELVLRQVRENLSWTPGTQRALVMIGDTIPHDPDFHLNKDNIDWKVETAKLKEMGVNIYAVQAENDSDADFFWEGMAKMTDGKHLDLEQFQTIVDMIMAICYRETGPDFFEAYEREVRVREGAGIRAELDHMFDALRDPEDVSTSATAATAAAAVPSAVSPKTTRTRGAEKSTTSTLTRGAKRSHDDDDSDDDDDRTGTEGVTTRAKTARVMAKKPLPLKKTPSSIVAAKLVKKAKLSGVTKARKQKRETIPQTRFALNNLKWSPWHTAMADKAPGEDDEAWSPRRGEHDGVRNTALFQNDTECPAVYEFAVQAKRRCKKYPVYFSTTRGFSQQKWDTYLLKQQEVTEEVDEVLKKGCKLYVRRAKVEKPVKCEDRLLSSVDELRSLIAQTYDYAWTAPHSVRDRHRQVTRNGVAISNISC